MSNRLWYTTEPMNFTLTSRTEPGWMGSVNEAIDETLRSSPLSCRYQRGVYLIPQHKSQHYLTGGLGKRSTWAILSYLQLAGSMSVLRGSNGTFLVSNVAGAKDGPEWQAAHYTYNIMTAVAFAKAERVVALDFLSRWRRRSIRDAHILHIVAAVGHADSP